MDVLLNILEAEQDQSARLSSMPPCCQPLSEVVEKLIYHLAAVIYIKNRVNRSWARTEQYPTEHLIPEDEKARFRDRLLPVMAASTGLVRQQIIPVLQRILHFDFPDKWPNFMDYAMQLLNTNDTRSVLAGLQCLLAMCRAWRFRAPQSESRVHFDKIIEASFPRLLAICNELVAQESDEAGEMLHLALKAYKHATWVRRFSPPPSRHADCDYHSWSSPATCASAMSTLLGALCSSTLSPKRSPRVLWSKKVTRGRNTTGGSRRSGLIST